MKTNAEQLIEGFSRLADICKARGDTPNYMLMQGVVYGLSMPRTTDEEQLKYHVELMNGLYDTAYDALHMLEPGVVRDDEKITDLNDALESIRQHLYE